MVSTTAGQAGTAGLDPDNTMAGSKSGTRRYLNGTLTRHVSKFSQTASAAEVYRRRL